MNNKEDTKWGTVEQRKEWLKNQAINFKLNHINNYFKCKWVKPYGYEGEIFRLDKRASSNYMLCTRDIL